MGPQPEGQGGPSGWWGKPPPPPQAPGYIYSHVSAGCPGLRWPNPQHAMNPCPASPANSAESGSSGGPGSHTSEPPASSPVGLLVVRFPQALSREQEARMRAHLLPAAKHLNLEVLVADGGADAHIQQDNRALIAALHQQTEAINRLAASNEQLVQAMAEAGSDEDEPTTYLDGTRRRMPEGLG